MLGSEVLFIGCKSGHRHALSWIPYFDTLPHIKASRLGLSVLNPILPLLLRVREYPSVSSGTRTPAVDTVTFNVLSSLRDQTSEREGVDLRPRVFRLLSTLSYGLSVQQTTTIQVDGIFRMTWYISYIPC
jgi:hypothetical protein